MLPVRGASPEAGSGDTGMDASGLQHGGGRGENPQRLRLSRLIAESLVEPVFQPIVDLQRGEVAGFETLSRPAAMSGFENPAALFDTAAAFDMLWPLEAVTRKAAFDAAAAWPAELLLFV